MARLCRAARSVGTCSRRAVRIDVLQDGGQLGRPASGMSERHMMADVHGQENADQSKASPIPAGLKVWTSASHPTGRCGRPVTPARAPTGDGTGRRDDRPGAGVDRGIELFMQGSVGVFALGDAAALQLGNDLVDERGEALGRDDVGEIGTGDVGLRDPVLKPVGDLFGRSDDERPGGAEAGRRRQLAQGPGRARSGSGFSASVS